MKQHKWYNEIVAWAGGAEIEAKSGICWRLEEDPEWNNTEYVFRIKPQPKEPKYLYVFHNIDKGTYEIGEKPHPQMNYRPIIGKIKLESDDA